MIQEIMFRGKRVDNGEWVYGDLIKHYENQRRFIAYGQLFYTCADCGINKLVTERFYEVKAETIGQFTGLQDKNGIDIYEGDVVRIEHDITETQSLGSIENKDLSVWEEVVETFEVEDVVVFVNGSFDVQEWAVGIFMPYEIEVIGNIHDQ